MTLRKDYETLSMDTISDAINNYNYSIEVINDSRLCTHFLY